VYNDAGRRLDVELVPFAQSLAGTAVSLEEVCVVQHLEQASPLDLQPFEKGRQSLLAAPMTVAPGLHAVIELFDKETPGASFSAEDKRLAQSAANLGADLLRQALGQRQAQQMLLDAVAAALGAGEEMAQSLGSTSAERLQQPPPVQVLDQLRQGLSAGGADRAGAEQSLRLAEAIRVLALRHGTPALEHCVRLVEQIRALLDQVTEPTASGD
jgi:two-component system nitrogen regulation response regulator NtrX